MIAWSREPSGANSPGRASAVLPALAFVASLLSCGERGGDPPGARAPEDAGVSDQEVEPRGAAEQGGGDAHDGDLDGWNVMATENGHFTVAWKTDDGTVPRNEDFAFDVRVLRGGAPADGATLAVTGWMPDHGHGTIQAPIVTARGRGRFRVEGMLLHMRGLWHLIFEVVDHGTADAARFEVRL